MFSKSQQPGLSGSGSAVGATPLAHPDSRGTTVLPGPLSASIPAHWIKTCPPNQIRCQWGTRVFFPGKISGSQARTVPADPKFAGCVHTISVGCYTPTCKHGAGPPTTGLFVDLHLWRKLRSGEVKTSSQRCVGNRAGSWMQVPFRHQPSALSHHPALDTSPVLSATTLC